MTTEVASPASPEPLALLVNCVRSAVGAKGSSLLLKAALMVGSAGMLVFGQVDTLPRGAEKLGSIHWRIGVPQNQSWSPRRCGWPCWILDQQPIAPSYLQ